MSGLISFFRGSAVIAFFAFATPTYGQEFDFSSVASMQESVMAAQQGMSDADKKEFAEALLRILIARHPLTKDLEAFPAMMVLGSQGEAFYTSAGNAFEGITPEVVQAEVLAFKASRNAKSQEGAAAAGTADAILACLKSKVALENPRFESTDGSWFMVDITNSLSWAIRGYHVSFVIKADGRSVPVKEDKSSGEISGGIEPGETKTVSVWAGADISTYKTISIEVALINLFDPEDRRLVDNNITYIGRSPDISPFVCE